MECPKWNVCYSTGINLYVNHSEGVEVREGGEVWRGGVSNGRGFSPWRGEGSISLRMDSFRVNWNFGSSGRSLEGAELLVRKWLFYSLTILKIHWKWLEMATAREGGGASGGRGFCQCRWSGGNPFQLGISGPHPAEFRSSRWSFCLGTEDTYQMVQFWSKLVKKTLPNWWRRSHRS